VIERRRSYGHAQRYTFALELIMTSTHDGMALQAKTCGFPATGDFRKSLQQPQKIGFVLQKS
jgi:hypothetical protein